MNWKDLTVTSIQVELAVRDRELRDLAARRERPDRPGRLRLALHHPVSAPATPPRPATVSR